MSTPRCCSFCGKTEHEVEWLVARNDVYICGACVRVCMATILAQPKREQAVPVGLVRAVAWETATRVRGEPDEELAEEFAIRLRAFIDKRATEI